MTTRQLFGSWARELASLSEELSSEVRSCAIFFDEPTDEAVRHYSSAISNATAEFYAETCADLHPDSITETYAAFLIHPVRNACSVLRDSVGPKIDAFGALVREFRATLQSSRDLGALADDDLR